MTQLILRKIATDMAKKKALGRGLKGLIPQGEYDVNPQDIKSNMGKSSVSNSIRKIKIADIKASKWQPRSHFNQEKLQELADSIREQGLVQPIVVREKGENIFELIAGERRLRAMTLLGWEEAPACLLDASDNKMRELALVENLQRDDLNAIETAVAYELLQNEEGLTHNDIGEKLGISRTKVTNTLRLLNLPHEVKNMIAEEKLSAAHGRTLLGLSDPLSQIELAKRIIEEALSVHDVEQIVKRLTSSRLSKPKTATIVEKDRNVLSLEEQLCSHFGARVSVNDKGGVGTITIKYNSMDEVAGILEKIGINEDI